MAIQVTSRFTACDLMRASGIARIIIKDCLKEGMISADRVREIIKPEFDDGKISDALEYIYRWFSMFSWLTLGGNSIDDPFVLDKLSKDLTENAKSKENKQ